MRSLKAFSFLFGFVIVAGCQGPDEFYRLSNDGDKTGTAGSWLPGTAGTTATGTAGTSATGTAGTTGNGGSIISGSAGATGNSGTGGSTVGYAGSTGSAGNGNAGSTGTAGTTGTGGGAAGTSGTAGSTGNAGSTRTAGNTGTGRVAGGRGGTTGTAGTGGSTASRGGTTGTAGSSAGSGGATGGTTGSGGGGGRGPDRIQVVAQCQATNGAQDIRVTLKILNPESTAKQWSDIKFRYYFTPSMALPAMVKYDFLQKISETMLTSTVTSTYVEIGFTTGAGMINGFDTVTGSDQIQLHLYNYSSPSWNTSQTDDYSYKSCTGVSNTSAYADRLTMPGYYQGVLAWGTEARTP